MRFTTISLFLLLASLRATGQSVLFETGFEDPSAFTLNTADVGGTATGSNTWLINAEYTGGDGLADCLGLELPFTIPSTPAQPAGINSPNGPYMHITSTEALNDGILCCSFGAADGFCTPAGQHFARMSSDVSTTGSSTVTLGFWWICNGGNNNYGEVYYSINGGVDWTVVTTPIQQYRNTATWTQQTISLPVFAGQPTLRFGFRFVNQQSLLGGSDPAFAVDDVRIIGTGTQTLSITSPVVPGTEFCLGSTISIPFTASGTFAAGNTFSVQLSDAAGSFTSPVTIGSLEATTSGSIPCTWPLGVVPGSGYRIRIVSDAPNVVGAPNGVDLALFATPFPGTDAVVSACPGGATIFLFEELGGAPVTCGVWTDPAGQPFDGVYEPGVDSPGTYTYTTDCGGPCPTQDAQVVVQETAGGAGDDVEAALCANGGTVSPFDYISGGVGTGSFFLNGAPFDGSALGVPGTYAIDYVVAGTQGCGNDTAEFVFDVIAPPDAGSSVSHTTCITTPPFALIGLLGGAQPGGVWTDPDGDVVDGVLNPSTDVAGLYTYTVQGDAPCADDQAFVALVIDPCVGLLERSASELVLRWIGQGADGHRLRQGGTGVPDMLRVIAADGRELASEWSAVGGELVVRLNTAAEGVYTILVGSGASTGHCRIVHSSL